MRLPCLICFAWLVASVTTGQSPLRFHESFDKPGPGWSLVDGRIGKAGTAGAKGIRVPTTGHLDKRQGTICLWVRPQWDGGQPVNHGFVADEIDFNRIGENNLYLWYWSVGLLRFDVRDPKDSYLTFDVKAWRAGQWHHVAAAWDCTRGLWLFVDGRLVAHRAATWKPRDASHFRIGSNWTGSNPANAAFDDFRIYDRVLDADLVALVMKGRPLPVVKYEKLIAPDRVVEGKSFDVSLEMGDSKGLTPDAKMSLSIDGFGLGTFPLGQAVRVVVPRYLHLDGGQHKLRAKVVGSLAATAVPERKVTFEAPARSSSPVWSKADGKVLLNGKQLPKDGSGLFFEKKFYTGEAAQAKARELIDSGEIVDAIPCRLLDEVDCTTTSHDFHENSPSRLVELVPGRKFRVCGPRDVVKKTVRLWDSGPERKALPAFSYRLRTMPRPTPHLLVVESINDTERNLEVVIGAAPGSRPSLVLSQAGPGSMQPNLAVVCTGREFPPDGKPFRQTFLFYPKSNVAEVTISASGRELKETDSPGSAVSRMAVYEITRPLAQLANPIEPPAKQRHLALFYPSVNSFLREYGFSGTTLQQRRASIREMFDYMHFLGFDRFEFHPYAFSRAAYLNSTKREQTGKPDIFDDVLPIAEAAGISVVPRMDSLCFHGDVWKDEPINYQLTKDGKVPDVFGKCPDPLRPPVQKLLLDMLGEMLRRCKGYKCVAGVGFRANAKFGVLYVSSHRLNNMPPEESGYSKWDIEAFEHDSGISVPVAHADPKACHEWLKANAWEKWIDWRCGKMRGWWLQARDLARGHGRELFVRTIIPYTHHHESDKTQWYGHKVPPLALCRNHGFDPRLFHDDSGLFTSEYFSLGADRYNHGRVHNRAFWHDPRLDGLIRTADGSEIELYYIYWELPAHPSGFAVGPSHMAGRAAFEPLTRALRTRNPYSLIFYNWHRATRGIDIELRQFARAYRGLPAVQPRPFGGDCAPKPEGGLWVRWFDDRLAVVNDSGRPRTVTLTISNRDANRVFDLAVCRTVGEREQPSAPLRCKLHLRAYDLRTLIFR